MPICIDVGCASRVPQHILHPIAERFERRNVVSHDPHFNRSFHYLSLLQLLHENLRFGSGFGQPCPQCRHQLRRSLHLLGVHQDLRIIGGRRLRVHVVVEAGRALAQKAGVRLHQRLPAEDRFDLAHGCVGSLDLGAFRQPHIHHELVPLGQGKEQLRHQVQQPKPNHNSQHAGHQNQLLVLHGPRDDLVVVPLHVVQRSDFARRTRIFLLVIPEPLADKKARQERRQQHGHNVGSG